MVASALARAAAAFLRWCEGVTLTAAPFHMIKDVLIYNHVLLGARQTVCP